MGVNIRKLVNRQNYYRKKHCATKLKYDKNIAQYAQNWAKWLGKNYNCEIIHRQDIGRDFKDFGENIYRAHSSSKTAINKITGKRISDVWYNEIKNYDYQKPRVYGFPQVGHFTQTVWKGSTKIGCGVAKCKRSTGKYGLIAVCNYSPHGNIMTTDCKTYPDICIQKNVGKNRC